MTKAERTIGTPGVGQAAGEPADGQDDPGRRTPGTAARRGAGAAASGGSDGARPRTPPRRTPGPDAGTDGGAAGAARARPADAGAVRRRRARVPARHRQQDAASSTTWRTTRRSTVLGQYLQLEAIRNSGAAFGIGQGMTIVFTVIALGRHRGDRPAVAPALQRAVGDRAGPAARRRAGQPHRPDLPRRPASSGARWSTSSPRRTSRSSTSPTPRSCAAAC